MSADDDKDVELPRAIRVERTGTGPEGSLDLTRTWFRPATLFMVFFALAWDGCLALVYGAAFTEAGVNWVLLVVFVFQGLVAVALSYAVVAALVNRTHVRIDAGALSVTHGPMPWPGRVALPKGAVVQLYSRHHDAHSQSGSQGATTWSLFAVTASDAHVELVRNLASRKQAVYLERSVEAQLGIMDDRSYDEV